MFLASEELSPEKNGTKSGIHTQGKLLAKPLASLYVPGQEPFLPPCVLASMVRVCKLGRDSHSARHTVKLLVEGHISCQVRACYLTCLHNSSLSTNLQLALGASPPLCQDSACITPRPGVPVAIVHRDNGTWWLFCWFSLCL